MKNLAARNINIDFVKCLAAFGVVSVHFFAYIGFYEAPLMGSRMGILNIIRTACMTCVPLFLITTGYLMQKKQLNTTFYKGLIRNLSIYLMITLACIAYRHFAEVPPYRLTEGLVGIFAFDVTPYAWYMEMYLGLFLLIPFLNMIYNNLPSRKAKLVLLGTVGLLSVGPTVFNLWINLVPDWWLALWPLTYYFIGCYLREYPLALGKKSKASWLLLAAFVLWVVLCATWNLVHAQSMPGGVIDISDLYWWSSIQNVVSSVLLFTWAQSLDFSRAPLVFRRVVVRISGLSLGLYLCSYIFDKTFYPLFMAETQWAGARLELLVVAVPLVFICSGVFSQLIDWTYQVIAKTLARVKRKIGVSSSQ